MEFEHNFNNEWVTDKTCPYVPNGICPKCQGVAVCFLIRPIVLYLFARRQVTLKAQGAYGLHCGRTMERERDLLVC